MFQIIIFPVSVRHRNKELYDSISNYSILNSLLPSLENKYRLTSMYKNTKNLTLFFTLFFATCLRCTTHLKLRQLTSRYRGFVVINISNFESSCVLLPLVTIYFSRTIFVCCFCTRGKRYCRLYNLFDFTFLKLSNHIPTVYSILKPR